MNEFQFELNEKARQLNREASCFLCEGPINSTSIHYARLVMVRSERAYFGGELLVKTATVRHGRKKRNKKGACEFVSVL